MKTSVWLPGLLALIPACGFAQVTVNPAALRQLQGLPLIAPAVQPAVAKPHVKLPPAKPFHHTKPAKPAPLPLPPPAPPSVPAPKVPPMVPVAPKPVAPKPIIPTLARIQFSPGSATLPASAADTLKPFCASQRSVPVVTRAPADPSDPSSAMRLSMARAFAIRDALIACGVPAQNIIPRAAGTVPGADNNEAQIGASAKP
ncbi:OmpA family protein [Acidocella aminolytica]|nr:OmpA family protein [Acidocella aminolytica]